MALVIRFVDQKYNIRKEFIKFVHCNIGLWWSISQANIKWGLQELGLSMTKCWGQSYHAAGVMAGCQSWAATRIANAFPKIIFIHYFSHRLNLSVMLVVKVKPVQELFANIQVIADSFNNSAKRCERFLEAFQYTLGSESSISKLIDIWRTRWIDRIEGLSHFKEAYAATFKALKSIGSGELFDDTKWNTESLATATGLALAMKKFE